MSSDSGSKYLSLGCVNSTSGSCASTWDIFLHVLGLQLGIGDPDAIDILLARWNIFYFFARSPGDVAEGPTARRGKDRVWTEEFDH